MSSAKLFCLTLNKLPSVFTSRLFITSYFSTFPKMPNRYSETYVAPKGAGDARPTALQIIKDEKLEGKLQDKVILITGCSSGIGIETARSLATTGAKLFLTARNLSKAKSALSGILKPGQVELIELDNASLASVRKGAEEFLQQSGNKLNILIANAGIMANPTRELNADGFEAQFGTNHLSHFLLFNLVKDAMLSSSTPTSKSRVVIVSSVGHRMGKVQFGNYDYSDPNGAKYSPWSAYGQSKTATIYMANYIDRVYGPKGVHALSLHPGGISTGLQVHVDGETQASWAKDEAIRNIMKSVEQGAATQVYAAVGKEWEGKGGIYLEDCDTAPASADAESSMGGRGAALYAFDVAAEDRMWKDSMKMVEL